MEWFEAHSSIHADSTRDVEQNSKGEASDSREQRPRARRSVHGVEGEAAMDRQSNSGKSSRSRGAASGKSNSSPFAASSSKPHVRSGGPGPDHRSSSPVKADNFYRPKRSVTPHPGASAMLPSDDDQYRRSSEVSLEQRPAKARDRREAVNLAASSRGAAKASRADLASKGSTTRGEALWEPELLDDESDQEAPESEGVARRNAVTSSATRRHPGYDEAVINVNGDSGRGSRSPTKVHPVVQSSNASTSSTALASEIARRSRRNVHDARQPIGPPADDLESLDGLEEITEFTPSPRFADKGKGKQPTQSRKAAMQTRNGDTPYSNGATLQVNRSARGNVPSSGLKSTMPHFFAAIDKCALAIRSGCRLLDWHNMKLTTAPPNLELLRRDSSDTWRIPIMSVTKAEFCDHPPFCRLVFTLTPAEVEWVRTVLLNGELAENPLELRLFLRPETEGFRLLRELRSQLGKQTVLPHTILPANVEKFYSLLDDTTPRRRRLALEPSRRAAEAAEVRNSQAQSTIQSSTRNRKARDAKAKEREEPDPTQAKLSFVAPEAQFRRSGRIRRSSAVQESGDDDVTPVPAPSRKSPREDRTELLFPYPLTGRSEVHVTKGDRYRIEDNEFLNDTFVEFGLRYILDEQEPEVQSSVHLFNSFFYERLSRKSPKERLTDEDWPAYDSVKKWTKSAAVFDKKWLVIPINESFHWFLAVIYNPAGALRSENTPSALQPPPALRRDDDAVSAASKSPREGSTSNDLSHPAAEESRDPLDVMSEDEEEKQQQEAKDQEDVVDLVGGLRLEPSPQPIASQTLDIFNLQGECGSGTPVIQEHEDLHTVTESRDEQAPARNRRDFDYDIGGSDCAFIMCFDSLGHPHKAVANNLKRWLVFEAQDKLGKKVDLKENVQVIDAKVPLQPNFSDCGVFLVHYVKTMLENPGKVLTFVGKLPGKKKDEWEQEKNETWNKEGTGSLRQEWLNRINLLTGQYQSLQEGHPGDSNTLPEASQASVLFASQQPREDDAAEGVPHRATGYLTDQTPNAPKSTPFSLLSPSPEPRLSPALPSPPLDRTPNRDPQRENPIVSQRPSRSPVGTDMGSRTPLDGASSPQQRAAVHASRGISTNLLSDDSDDGGNDPASEPDEAVPGPVDLKERIEQIQKAKSVPNDGPEDVLVDSDIDRAATGGFQAGGVEAAALDRVVSPAVPKKPTRSFFVAARVAPTDEVDTSNLHPELGNAKRPAEEDLYHTPVKRLNIGDSKRDLPTHARPRRSIARSAACSSSLGPKSSPVATKSRNLSESESDSTTAEYVAKRTSSKQTPDDPDSPTRPASPTAVKSPPRKGKRTRASASHYTSDSAPIFIDHPDDETSPEHKSRVASTSTKAERSHRSPKKSTARKSTGGRAPGSSGLNDEDYSPSKPKKPRSTTRRSAGSKRKTGQQKLNFGNTNKQEVHTNPSGGATNPIDIPSSDEE